MIDAVIPPHSVLGIIMRGIYSRNRNYIHMLRVRHLMDLDTLNKRIEYIKNLANSGDTPLKYCIINLYSKNAGLLSLVLAGMPCIIYSVSKGMIPVFDMRHSGIYLEEDEEGKVNAWEKYFKQPCGYGLDDIGEGKTYKSQPVPLSHAIFEKQDSFTERLQIWSSLFGNFFELNDGCAEYVEREYRNLIKPGMRVVGVFCRGTDYVKMRQKGCYIQPDVEDVITKVKEVIPKWKCDYVYITTEERRIVERFENAFPGKVLTVPQNYYDDFDVDYSQTHIGRVRFDRENDKFLKGLEYLSSVMVLSRCTSAVMGVASGSIAALYINGGKYENVYAFDLGKYP